MSAGRSDRSNGWSRIDLAAVHGPSVEFALNLSASCLILTWSGF
jgi:hypothetical protein